MTAPEGAGGRDWRAEGRQVAVRAARDRTFRSAARVIGGAVTDVYERTAAELLEASAPTATERGWTVEQHHDAVVIELLLLAATALLSSLKRT